MVVEYADKTLVRSILAALEIVKPLPRKGRALHIACANGKRLTVTKWNNLLYRMTIQEN